MFINSFINRRFIQKKLINQFVNQLTQQINFFIKMRYVF